MPSSQPAPVETTAPAIGRHAGCDHAGSNDAIAIFADNVYNLLGRDPPVSATAPEGSFFPDCDVPRRFIFARYRQRF